MVRMLHELTYSIDTEGNRRMGDCDILKGTNNAPTLSDIRKVITISRSEFETAKHRGQKRFCLIHFGSFKKISNIFLLRGMDSFFDRLNSSPRK